MRFSCARACTYALRCVAAGGREFDDGRDGAERGERRAREKEGKRRTERGDETDPLVLRSGPPPLTAKQTCNHVPTVVVLSRLPPSACCATGPAVPLTCPVTREKHRPNFCPRLRIFRIVALARTPSLSLPPARFLSFPCFLMTERRETHGRLSCASRDKSCRQTERGDPERQGE